MEAQAQPQWTQQASYPHGYHLAGPSAPALAASSAPASSAAPPASSLFGSGSAFQPAAGGYREVRPWQHFPAAGAHAPVFYGMGAYGQPLLSPPSQVGLHQVAPPAREPAGAPPGGYAAAAPEQEPKPAAHEPKAPATFSGGWAQTPVAEASAEQGRRGGLDVGRIVVVDKVAGEDCERHRHQLDGTLRIPDHA